MTDYEKLAMAISHNQFCNPGDSLATIIKKLRYYSDRYREAILALSLAGDTANNLGLTSLAIRQNKTVADG